MAFACTLKGRSIKKTHTGYTESLDRCKLFGRCSTKGLHNLWKRVFRDITSTHTNRQTSQLYDWIGPVQWADSVKTKKVRRQVGNHKKRIFFWAKKHMRQVTCDRLHVTGDMWHVTVDTWLVTRHTWHVTHGVRWTVSQDFSSLALRIWDSWCFEYSEEEDHLLNQLTS